MECLLSVALSFRISVLPYWWRGKKFEPLIKTSPHYTVIRDWILTIYIQLALFTAKNTKPLMITALYNLLQYIIYFFTVLTTNNRQLRADNFSHVYAYANSFRRIFSIKTEVIDHTQNIRYKILK